MSHSVESLQRMSTAQLENIMRNSQWSFERDRARQVLERRRSNSTAYVNQLQNTVNDLQGRIRNLNSANSAIQRSLTQAQNQINTMASQHAQQMRDMRENFDGRLQALDRQHHRDLRELTTAYNTALRQQSQQLQTQIHAVAADANARIDAVHNEVAAIQTRMDADLSTMNNLRQQAIEYLSGADAVLENVDANNPHRWRAEERSTLQTHRIGIVDDLNVGHVTASVARSNARQLFEDALVYQQHVLADEREWQIRFEATDEAVAQAEAFLEVNAIQTVATSSGDLTLNVDYWTCGDLTRIQEGLAAIRRRMKDPNLTGEQLQALQELAIMYRMQTEQAVNYALIACRLSRSREQLMRHAIQLLTDRGRGNYMTLQWAEYFNGDQRLGYRAYLIDADGTRVVITAELNDAQGDEPGNTFRSEILEYGTQIRSAQQADAYNRALLARLYQETRVQFGDSVCSHPDNVVPDVGQSSEQAWKHPDADSSVHEVDRVGLRVPANELAQMNELLNHAGIPLRERQGQ